MSTKNEAYSVAHTFLHEQHTATLATASMEGVPEASVIHYVINGDNHIYFTTFPKYRKYANLKTNPQVSLVITDGIQALQIEGTAEELPIESRKEAIKLLILKYGYGTNFYKDDDLRLFCISPTWERVILSKQWPPELVEINPAHQRD